MFLEMDGMKIGFIGAGKVATALACGLSHKGYAVVAVSSRGHASAARLAGLIPRCQDFPDNQEVAERAEMVFIATPDDAIAPVASRLKWRPAQCVVHCSGADSSAVLAPARKAGAKVGVFHPLQTFAGSDRPAKNLASITFAIEAEEPLLTELRKMAESLGGHTIVLRPQDKVLYHASAVLASNYLVTLVGLASELWATFGASQEEAVRALLPLLRGTVNNIESIGLPNCLTGPIARGDTGTIKKHLSALREGAPKIEAAYRQLGLKTIPIALAKGHIDSAKAIELEKLLRGQDE